MKRTLTAASLLAAAMACNAGPTDVPDTEQVAAARNAIKALGSALKAELGAAMQAGGPVAAVEVCSTKAMPITRQISAELGLETGRVSLRNRNPSNAANAWQQSVLEEFERKRAEGADPAGLDWSTTVETAGGREFRYMQAIPTVGVCLACHGTNVPPEVSRVLSAIYPDDRATGFSEGDIRGAFVVTRMVQE